MKITTRRRSGKLLAVNDTIIAKLLNDEYYRVTEDGVVWTRFTQQGHASREWRPKKLCSRNGYLSFRYFGKRIRVHRLIYAAFVGKLKADLVVNHIDGNPSNNNRENLELITQSENQFHSFRTLGRGK